MSQSPAFIAAVTVLRSYFRTPDKQPLQLTAIDLGYFVQQLPLRMGSPVERELHLSMMTDHHEITEFRAKGDDLPSDVQAMLDQCNTILLNPGIFSSGIQFVAACLYWHYLPQGEKR